MADGALRGIAGLGINREMAAKLFGRERGSAARGILIMEELVICRAYTAVVGKSPAVRANGRRGRSFI